MTGLELACVSKLTWEASSFFTRNLDTIDFVFYEYKALLKARAIVLKQKIKDEYEPVFNDKEEI